MKLSPYQSDQHDVTQVLRPFCSDFAFYPRHTREPQENVLIHGDKGKAPMGTDTDKEFDLAEEERISRLLFGLEEMEAYYLSFKEKRSITEEARSNVTLSRLTYPISIDNSKYGIGSFHSALGPLLPRVGAGVFFLL
ncbi:hypothetical protein HAX54_028987 [Datura stramonium]|uniref:Uncharacterized protein n=1 Tax=Datura stramonium TaxID=4076 RepID=A0ABS8V8G7_DATST|nr:hypothetical protein [Datura stramonium]